MVECSYCACRVVVERRLRTSEPEVGDPRALRRLEWEEVTSTLHCGGCGAPLDYDESQLVLVCPACKTQARVERRLRRLFSAPGDTEPDCTHTLALIRKVAHEPELADRVLAAEALQDWHWMNATLARHMPELMRAIGTADPRLGFSVARVVGRMLCTDDRFQHDCVLEAAAEVLFDVAGSRALLFELGMGPGTGFKLLLDVAQWACQQGAVDYGCTALWGAGQILQRHYEEHDVLRQVLLYRVLYLEGPVLGWAVLMINSQLGVAMRYPPDMLLRFVDEAARERPEVAAALCQSLQEGEAPDGVAYQARLERLLSLQTSLARAQALRMLHAPPEGSSLRLLRKTMDTLLPLLDDQALVPAVVTALRAVFNSPAGVPQAVHDLIRQRGDSLPEDFRRLYLEHRPDCPHLSELPVRYWQSSSQEEPLREAVEAWRAGISQAVEAYRVQETRADDYRTRIGQRTPLMAAATRGDVRLVSELLERGEDPDEVNSSGWTALMFAAEAGRVSAVRLLLDRGADACVRDEAGRQALTVAALERHRAVLDELRQAVSEADIAQVYRESFIQRNWPALEWALANDADPDTLEDEGRTPLVLASREGDLALVRRLLAAGAYLHHTDSSGRCALIHAARRGHLSLVRLLLAAGADPERTDREGETARGWAAKHGHIEVEQALDGS